MRSGSRHGVLVGLLLLATLVGGCTSAPTASDDDIPEGLTQVEIWVKRPLSIEEVPVRSLTAFPHRLAFTPADNETRARVGAGIWAYTEGWPEGYNLTAEGRPPADVARNWMKDATLWYKGNIPAGNYSTIRIELASVEGEVTHGRDAYFEVMFGRLSFDAAEDHVFQFPEGETVREVFAVTIEQISDTSYMIK